MSKKETSKPRVGRTPDILRKGGPMENKKRKALIDRVGKKWKRALKELAE